MYFLSCPWTQQLLRNVIRDSAAVAGPHDKGTSCIFKACCPFYVLLPFLPVFHSVSENTDLRINHARLCPTVVQFPSPFLSFASIKLVLDVQVIHREGLNWILLRPMWGLWWTKWHQGKLASECLSFCLSVSFHQWSLLSHPCITGTIQTKQ